MSEMKTAVRTAIIGTGGMGRKYAQMILTGTIKGLLMTAMVCRSSGAKQWADEMAERIPKGTPAPKIFDSAAELFAEPDLFDAVLIVTPHRTHPELAKQAFALGKHVLCDKPAGITADPETEVLDLDTAGITITDPEAVAALIDQMPKLDPLKESDKSVLLEGLDGVISQRLQDKIWDMIWKRWCYYEDFSYSRCNR